MAASSAIPMLVLLVAAEAAVFDPDEFSPILPMPRMQTNGSSTLIVPPTLALTLVNASAASGVQRARHNCVSKLSTHANSIAACAPADALCDALSCSQMCCALLWHDTIPSFLRGERLECTRCTSRRWLQRSWLR